MKSFRVGGHGKGVSDTILSQTAKALGIIIRFV